MTKKERATLAVAAMTADYPENIVTLAFEKPYELLFATRMAAQSTDERVNIVTKDLYRRYPTLASLAEADPKTIESIIRPVGLGATKARDIVGASKLLVEQFGGQVPNTMEELLTLPGIGRKTANLILGDVFGLPAVVVDTHCIRITNLLGITSSKNPDVVERQLLELLDPTESNSFCHRLVLHGRAVCIARRPQCTQCSMADFCMDYQGKQS